MRSFARTFAFLSEHPYAGHLREDLGVDRAVRFWPVFSYLVAYVPAERPVAIVAIVHGARDPEDLRSRLREARPGNDE